MAPATSAVELPMPLLRGMGESIVSRTPRWSRRKKLRAARTARAAFGASDGAMMRPSSVTSTLTAENRSTGHDTRKWLPSSIPCATSPQVPGAYTVADVNTLSLDVPQFLAPMDACEAPSPSPGRRCLLSQAVRPARLAPAPDHPACCAPGRG